MDCPKDDFQAFGATDGSTVDNRITFGVDRDVWTLAAKMDDGAPWHKRVLQGAEKFMTSWHSLSNAARLSFSDLCVCVCFLPIHSGHQVRWTYQPGSHRRKVTQDF